MATTKRTVLYKRGALYPVRISDKPKIDERCELLKIDGRILTWKRPNGETKRTTAPTNTRPRWFDNP